MERAFAHKADVRMTGIGMKEFIKKMSEEEMERRLERVAGLPLHKFLGLELKMSAPGEAVVTMPPTENALNAAGVVHGGILYAILDAACYLALLPLMEDGQNAVTHDIHASVLRPAPLDQPVVFSGKVRKMGRSVVFCDSEARSGGRLVALGRVSKSLIDMSGK